MNEDQKKGLRRKLKSFLPKLSEDQNKDLPRQLKCFSLEINFPPRFGTIFGRNLLVFFVWLCNAKLSMGRTLTLDGGTRPPASYLQFKYYQRLATAATFLRKELCCPGAMTRRWAPPTRYTLRRYAASIIKDLIWFHSIKLAFLVKSWLRTWLGAVFWNIEEITVSWKTAKNTRWISKSFSLWNYCSINDFQDLVERTDL